MKDLEKVIIDLKYKKISNTLYNNKDKWIELKNIQNSPNLSFKYFIAFQNKKVICYESIDNIKICTLIKRINGKQTCWNLSDQFGINTTNHQPYSYNLTDCDLMEIASVITNEKYTSFDTKHITCKYSLEIHFENKLKDRSDENIKQMEMYDDLMYDIDWKFKELFYINSNYAKYFNGVIYCFHSSYDTLTELYFIDKQSLDDSIEVLKNMKELHEIIHLCKETIYEFQCFVIESNISDNEYLIYDEYYKKNCSEVIIQYNVENTFDQDIYVKKCDKLECFFNNLQLDYAEVITSGYKCLSWNLIKINSVEYFNDVMEKLEKYIELKEKCVIQSVYMLLSIENL